MTERPILFSGAMVRALLDGRKTQTRRVVKFRGAELMEDHDGHDAEQPAAGPWPWSPEADGWVPCPYGAPGDRLWVRETWHESPSCCLPVWRADYPANALARGFENLPPESEVRWRPSIHMPRWASRLTLEVTGVRVERLQDISEEDARAEGAASRISPGGDLAGAFEAPGEVLPPIDYRAHFRDLWESINGADSWDANPWVWAISFRRVTP